ncbi:oxidoreductase [Spirosoma arcticum]
MKTQKTWFITGCSSGFGYEMALAALTGGDRVVATARKLDAISHWETQFPDQAIVIHLDVTKPDQITQAVKQAMQVFGQVDLLVNNAGFGLIGAIEEISDAEFRRIFDTDVFGLLNITRGVLPLMRRQRRGHIINFSSVAGIRGSAGLGAYNAAKFAVEGLSEALTLELSPLGIHVTIIEPGGFRTNWGGSSMLFSEQTINDYDRTNGGIRQFFESAQMPQRAGGNPKKLAQVIVEVAHMSQPPHRLALGTDAYAVVRDKGRTLLADVEQYKDLTFRAAE